MLKVGSIRCTSTLNIKASQSQNINKPVDLGYPSDKTQKMGLNRKTGLLKKQSRYIAKYAENRVNSPDMTLKTVFAIYDHLQITNLTRLGW